MTLLFLRKRKYQPLKGFSIGEVLLAAFVLTSGLLATSALMSTSLHNSFETRDAIIATQLSQEGIELVRNVRDNDFLVSGHDGFSNFVNQRYCRIDSNDPVPPGSPPLNKLDCTGSFGSASRYTLHYSAGAYIHSGSSSERFSRYIFIDYNSVQKNAIVRSFVYWGGIYSPPGGASSGNPNPPVPPHSVNEICSAKNKCVYTEVTLTSWK